MTKRKTTKKQLTPKQKAFLEAYIKNLGHITDSCNEIKINRASYYNWMNDDFFVEHINAAIENFNDSVQKRILKLALDEDKDMLKFWAKNKMKHRGWVEKQEISMSGSVKTDLTKEQIEEQIKRLTS